MNCFKSFFVVFFLSFVLCVNAFAISIDVVTEEFPPFNYTEKNIIVGFSTDVVKETLDRAKIDYVIRSYPWARAYNKALTDKENNVLIYSIGRSKDREKLFKWVDEPVASLDINLFKLKSRTDIKIKTLEDAKNYKMGVVKDDYRTQNLIKKGFVPKKHLDVVSEDRKNIRKLFKKRVDIVPIDGVVAAYLAGKDGLPFSKLEKVIPLKDLSVDLYMAFSIHADDALVEKCLKALKGIKKDGTYDKIKGRYLK